MGWRRVGSSWCSCGGGGVVGPVASRVFDPVTGGGDGDAEDVGENRGGEFGGEVDESRAASGSGVDAECAEAGSESAGGDGPTGKVAGEQPW